MLASAGQLPANFGYFLIQNAKTDQDHPGSDSLCRF